ncbi:hypothetical protein B0H21DRAFT_752461 [Amylocystis lapponica]|nr:hypothetical protein B0H21DRAFT_752461 [Amylocystis lapponica]
MRSASHSFLSLWKSRTLSPILLLIVRDVMIMIVCLIYHSQIISVVLTCVQVVISNMCYHGVVRFDSVFIKF